MIWAAILEDTVIGPYYFPHTATRWDISAYVYCLPLTYFEWNTIISLGRYAMWFQQDTAPLHFATVVSEYLKETFEDKWILLFTPIE